MRPRERNFGRIGWPWLPTACVSVSVGVCVSSERPSTPTGPPNRRLSQSDRKRPAPKEWLRDQQVCLFIQLLRPIDRGPNGPSFFSPSSSPLRACFPLRTLSLKGPTVLSILFRHVLSDGFFGHLSVSKGEATNE